VTLFERFFGVDVLFFDFAGGGQSGKNKKKCFMLVGVV